MHRRSELVFSALLVYAMVSPQAALAVNIGFLPGDACFHSKLTEALVSNFADQQTITLDYSRGENPGESLRGSAGYWSLSINDPDDVFRTRLADLYRDLRLRNPQQLILTTNEAGEKNVVETNGFHLFVYNANFTGPIGLKLNEHWMDNLKPVRATSEFVESNDRGKNEPGSSAEVLGAWVVRGPYEPFVTDYRAVAIDWDRAAEFLSLSVKLPDGVQGVYGSRIKVPVSIEASEAKVILLPNANITPYALGTTGEKHHYFALSRDGVKKVYISKNGDLVEEAWPKAGGETDDQGK